MRVEQLMRSLALAEDALEAELCRFYPRGTRLTILIRDGVSPSEVEVVSVIGGRHGHIRVRFASGFVTGIAHSQIVGKR